EPRVLGEKAVAGMHGVGAGFPRGVEDAVDSQVALGRWSRADRHGLRREAHVECEPVRVAVHRDCRDGELSARTDDADRDLSTVGDEDLSEHRDLARIRTRSLRRRAGGIIPYAATRAAGGLLDPGFRRLTHFDDAPYTPPLHDRSPRPDPNPR